MRIPGNGRRLAVVSVVFGLSVLAESPAAAQPGTGSDLLRIEDFDAACSKDTLDDRSDAMCRQAISMALGRAPAVEEVRGPDGRVTRTTKLLPADPAKAGRLGEEACGHGRWQSCMLYTMLLERGDGVPQDRARAEALTHYACSKGHALACDALQSRGTSLSATAAPPTTSERGEQRQPTADPGAVAMLEKWKQEHEAKQQQLSPEQQLLVFQRQQQQQQQAAAAQAAANAPAVGAEEADLITRCLAGTRDACYNLARGYEQGRGMARDATRATFYYEKACDIGHPAACAHLQQRASSASPSSFNGMLVGIPVLLGLVVVVIVATRRRAATEDKSARPRPAPVRPAPA